MKTNPAKNKPVQKIALADAQSRASIKQLLKITARTKEQVKTYVLDTNVLLHDPGSLGRFEENHVCIPVDVLAELDRFKNEQTERGANARQVHRVLVDLFHNANRILEGTPTLGGGSIRLAIYDPESRLKSPALRRFLRIYPDQDRVDHRILACTLLIQESASMPIVLVTKDLNMQLKALSVGLEVQDYLNDKIAPSELLLQEPQRIEVSGHELQRFASSSELILPGNRRQGVDVNDYVLLEYNDGQVMPARFHQNGFFTKLNIPEGLQIPNGHFVKPLNLGQKFLLDSLLNPEISLVTCYGQAGTGKTLLAVAAGLHEIYERRFNGLTVSRPLVSMGEELGFLPGGLNEKMRPWLQPIYDALDLLMRPPAIFHGPRRKQQKEEARNQRTTGSLGEVVPQKPYDALIEQGIIEIEALCYIRGRSIPNRFFILDEAQQLTPREAKTVVTRMSAGSKLVMVGDPAQIDNPYVDSRSNGLVYTRRQLRGQPFAAHIALTQGERSPLAEAGAKFM